MTLENDKAVEQISDLVYKLNEMIGALVNGLAPDVEWNRTWEEVLTEAEKAIENLDAVVWQDPMAGNWRD